MRLSRLAATLAALLVLAAVGASAAAAATVTRTVPGEYVFAHGQRPDAPGNCSAIIFVQWADVPGTIAATARYTSLSNGSWGERAETREAPFDDTYTWVTTYTAPPGTHWIAIGRGWSAGPRPNDCSAMSERQRPLYRTPVTVELTIQEPPACVAANASVAKITRRIATLQKQLARASAKRKRSLSRKLAGARRDLARAQGAAGQHCP